MLRSPSGQPQLYQFIYLSYSEVSLEPTSTLSIYIVVLFWGLPRADLNFINLYIYLSYSKVSLGPTWAL